MLKPIRAAIVMALIWSSALLIAGAEALAAQTATVTGQVVHSLSGRPLAGVQITVPGSGIGGLTGVSGRYSLANVPAGNIQVQAQMLGFRTETQSVTVSAGETGTADFRLSERAIEMDALVVTGTAGATERRQIGHAMAQIDASSLTVQAPISNVSQLLQARIPSGNVFQTSGNLGAGGPVTLRGVSSISQGSDPLVYIDGVRMDNRNSTGIWSGSSPSRLNDINPADIESVEVISGPAAATLYGSEASNGVIHIITKRGRAGEQTFNVMMRQGANWFLRPEANIMENWAMSPDGQLISQHLLRTEAELGNNPFRTGHVQEYSVDVRGGVDRIGYFASLTRSEEEGIVSNNWLERTSGRLNLTLQVVENLNISTGMGYVRSENARSPESFTGDFGLFGMFIFGSPNNQNNRLRGFLSAPPEEVALVDMRQNVNRTTWNMEVSHTPRPWFSHRLWAGLDVVDERNLSLWERKPEGTAHFFGQRSLGERDIRDMEVRNQTFDYAATADFTLSPELTSATSVGVQYYTVSRHFTTATGRIFPAPGLTTVSTAAQRQGAESFVENKTVGGYIQQRFGWRDQLFLTAAVRGDDNSAFGTEVDPALYPKLSGSWNVSQADFWNPASFLNDLVVRAAWGQAGQQPDAFAAIRTYGPSVGFNDGPAVLPSSPGNPTLKPERGSEVELGFDADLLNGRAGVEFTVFRQITSDAILNRAVPPSTGFSGSQVVNAGEIQNQGLELATRFRPVVRERVGWEFGVNVGHQKNKIISMGDVGNLFFGRVQGHVEDHAIGGFWSRRVVQAEWQGESLANVLCDGGPENNNLPMPCAQAPRVYMGDPGPNWQASLNTTLSLGENLRLYALVDGWFDMRLESVTNWGRDAVFRNSRIAHTLREQDPVLAAAISNPTDNSPWIHRNDFIRLREVSLSYTLPSEWASRVGASRSVLSVQGRNLGKLWVHPDFNDVDPESRPGANAWNHARQNVFPQLTRLDMSIRMTF